ncbi:hypothetical protein PLICRDRAFT_39008 [Plicaturopsis crispa FD-325 SS-3]|nr:hypothetical protein PLICRDRAFT_39008 [Plicaturopsis crispa FD-325 SS-3]
MSISVLPDEVIEHILVFCAEAGAPCSISAFSQTCKAFHKLVYTIQDNHLWREVFLTTFDDPRRVKASFKDGQLDGLGGNFSWKLSFQRRYVAARYIHNSDADSPDDPSLTLATLRSLCSVVSTALPFPLVQNLSFPVLPRNSALPSRSSPLPSIFPNYPAFPPLVLLMATGRLALVPPPQDSLNIYWLEELFKRKGYPPYLTRRILAGGAIVPIKYLENDDADGWHEFENAKLFYKLICCTGFIPIPAPETDSEYDNDSNVVPPLDLQHKLARRFARITVYDLRYLWGARHWGPFLPDHSRPHFEGDAVDFDGLMPLLLGNDEADRPSAPPDDDDDAIFYPDYHFLACARIVVEANLMDMLRQSEEQDEPDHRLEEFLGDAIRRLEGLRMGSAPGFWDAYEAANSNEEGADGWDWAGVEGEWRRCVCWLDYRDLLVHNLHSTPTRFRGDVEEVLRIVPMSLRVSGYSRSPHARLPTIFVEGESEGPPEGQGVSIRHIKGSVSAIGDSTVRWSLTSSYADSAAPEWATEGVQVGNVGSALGVLGLWTGAEHERTDPLGPFWAWKVA